MECDGDGRYGIPSALSTRNRTVALPYLRQVPSRSETNAREPVTLAPNVRPSGRPECRALGVALPFAGGLRRGRGPR